MTIPPTRLSAEEAYSALQATTVPQWTLLKAIGSDKVRAKKMPGNHIGMTGGMSFIRSDPDMYRGGRLCTVMARNMVLSGLAELNPLAPNWLRLPTEVKKSMAKIEQETSNEDHE